MFDAVDGLEAEHAELESRLGDPEVHADARLAKQLNQRYAELSRILAAKREYDELVADIGAARELAAEDPTFADEAEALADRLQGAEEQLRRLLVPARSHRRQGRDPRGEVRRGRRGVRAVRGRPAADVLALRGDPGVADRDPRRHRVRPRWLQVGHPGREGQGRHRAGSRAVRAAQVRGRRAPGPAGAGDRVPGPGAHERRRRPGAARGRAGRRHDRRQRPAHRRVPQQRAGRPERQHHRLRGPDHARADRASS